MAGSVQFKIFVHLKNEEALGEMAARAKDFRPAFEAIINEWAELNEQKFRKGKGAEATGVAVGETVTWDALTLPYMKRKRRLGYPDHLMKATGALEQALTDPDRFFQAMTAVQVAFGLPMSPDESIKVLGNFKQRQTIFLGLSDQNAIRRIVQDYLSLGPDFERIRFNKGLKRRMERTEAARMDIGFFEAMMGGES